MYFHVDDVIADDVQPYNIIIILLLLIACICEFLSEAFVYIESLGQSW